MNTTIKYVFSFSLGAAISLAVSWRILKARYEKISREEIASVKERYSKKRSEPVSEVEAVPEEPATDEATEETEIKECEQLVADLGYSEQQEKGTKATVKNKPYVISPEDFAGDDDYKKVSLVYYADGILACDDGEIVVNVDAVVGEDSLTHFGEYEDDSVYVRNDEDECDYEILLDCRRYKDVIGRPRANPPITEE